ncbi:MAG: hypothetical protein ACOC2F_08015 [Bacteroidota bacterium]
MINKKEKKFEERLDFNPLEAQNYYQCAYCNDYFLPKKRFVQKYCSESCRVMACRDRKTGKREKVPASYKKNTSGFHGTNSTKGYNQTPEHKNSKLLDELKACLDERDAKLLKKVEKIREQQNYHMWISALAPLLAEPVKKSLGRLFQGNKTTQDVNQFLQQVAPKIKELPEELQVMVLNASKEYWDANLGSNDSKHKMNSSGLPDLKGAL